MGAAIAVFEAIEGHLTAAARLIGFVEVDRARGGKWDPEITRRLDDKLSNGNHRRSGGGEATRPIIMRFTGWTWACLVSEVGPKMREIPLERHRPQGEVLVQPFRFHIGSIGVKAGIRPVAG